MRICEWADGSGMENQLVCNTFEIVSDYRRRVNDYSHSKMKKHGLQRVIKFEGDAKQLAVAKCKQREKRQASKTRKMHGYFRHLIEPEFNDSLTGI